MEEPPHNGVCKMFPVQIPSFSGGLFVGRPVGSLPDVPNHNDSVMVTSLLGRYNQDHIHQRLSALQNYQARREYLNRLLLEIQLDTTGTPGGVAGYVQWLNYPIQHLNQYIDSLMELIHDLYVRLEDQRQELTAIQQLVAVSIQHADHALGQLQEQEAELEVHAANTQVPDDLPAMHEFLNLLHNPIPLFN